MSRIIAWRHQGGGAAGHLFVWVPLGSSGQVAPVTVQIPQKLVSPAFSGTLNGAHT